MAHVSLTALTQITDGPTIDETKKLQELTAEEDAQPAYFSPEDIFQVLNQPGFDTIKKFKAVFWGFKYQVWVGLDAAGRPIQPGRIALRCPPYYNPFASPGADISAQNGTVPVGFPEVNCEVPPPLS